MCIAGTDSESCEGVAIDISIGGTRNTNREFWLII